MEPELGSKGAKILDDFDRLIAKDQTEPVFISKETDIMFILSAHLKGYMRQHIKIDINEDGSRIVISGEKPVQKMMMVEWKVYKKEIEMRGFRKAFKIPDAVILDKIKARFNEDESMLTISMPKVIQGVKGVEIEEAKVEEIARRNSKSLRVEADEESAELDGKDAQHSENVPEKLPVSADLDDKDAQKIDRVPEKLSVLPDRNEYGREMKTKDVPDLKGHIEEKATEKPPVFQENMVTDLQEHEESKWDQNGKDQLFGEKKQIDGTETREEEKSDDKKSTETEKKKFRDQSTQTDAPKRPEKCCTPVIAGSALLVSLMVFVIHLMRNNGKRSKKKQ